MKRISARQESNADGGYGFTDAIVGIVLLALAVILAGSILASAAATVERAENELRSDLEARRGLFDR